MYPWLWFWAPQLHFPWSGSVAQHIEPDMNLFFDLINPAVGNARIEQRAFVEVASYGKQLGMITEVLIDLARQSADISPKAKKTLASLEQIAAQIDALKLKEYQSDAARLVDGVKAVRDRGGAEYENLARRLRPLLPPGDA